MLLHIEQISVKNRTLFIGNYQYSSAWVAPAPDMLSGAALRKNQLFRT